MTSSCNAFGAWARRLRSLCTVQRCTGISLHRLASAALAAVYDQKLRRLQATAEKVLRTCAAASVSPPMFLTASRTFTRRTPSTQQRD